MGAKNKLPIAFMEFVEKKMNLPFVLHAKSREFVCKLGEIIVNEPISFAKGKGFWSL